MVFCNYRHLLHYCTCPNAKKALYITAPAHLHTTLVTVYPSLFLLIDHCSQKNKSNYFPFMIVKEYRKFKEETMRLNFCLHRSKKNPSLRDVFWRRPDTRPISRRLRVGRGSNPGWQGQYMSGQGLLCSRAGEIMLRNCYSLRHPNFCVMDLPTCLPRSKTSYRVA